MRSARVGQIVTAVKTIIGQICPDQEEAMAREIKKILAGKTMNASIKAKGFADARRMIIQMAIVKVRGTADPSKDPWSEAWRIQGKVRARLKTWKVYSRTEPEKDDGHKMVDSKIFQRAIYDCLRKPLSGAADQLKIIEASLHNALVEPKDRI
jgi:hypothetical protein